MEVVGEAGSTADALHRIPAARPDVAVLDVRLPDGSGVEVCREIRSVDARRALPHADVVRRRRGPLRRHHGGRLRLRPQGDPRQRPHRRDPPGGVGQVAARPDGHRSACSSDCATARSTTPASTRCPTRRSASSSLIGDGLTNRQIGEQMHLAEKTVKNYVSSLLAKLGMERRTQAAAYVARMSVENEHR